MYYLVTLKSTRGKIRWDLLEKCCVSYKSRLLLPSGCKIPENTSLSCYEKTEIESILLYNTMLNFIKSQNASIKHSSLCLFDPHGLLADSLTKSVEYFSKINIVTDRPDAYFDASENIMKNYGLSLTFSPKPLFTDENAVLVCRQAELIPLNFRGTAFCNGNICAPDCTAIKGKSILLKNELSKLIPPDINPLYFLSAVYQFSDSDILRDISFAS